MKTASDGQYLRNLLAGVLLLVVFTLQYSGIAPLTLAGMTAMLIVPSVIFCSQFNSPPAAAVFGLVAGAALDSVSSGAICFNAITLFLLALAASLLGTHLFNRNLLSALLLGTSGTAIYFLLKWLVFTAFGTPGASGYLLAHVLPSILYTAALSVPFCLLISRIYRVGRRWR